MGFFKKLLLGGAAAKTYQNVYNRPIVIAPPGYVIMGMRQRGVGSTCVITYAQEGRLHSTTDFNVSQGTTDVSMEGVSFKVNFPK